MPLISLGSERVKLRRVLALLPLVIEVVSCLPIPWAVVSIFLVDCYYSFFREESRNLSTMLDNSSQSTEVGTCQGLPAMLRAEILISEAGKYQGAAQMEVVGVKVT